jgi:hypothetical protein
MAEFKTYTCDRCGKQDALRLKFAVDTEDDPCDGKRSTVPGFADLCHQHAIDFLQNLIGDLSMDDQRALWKTMLSKSRY